MKRGYLLFAAFLISLTTIPQCQSTPLAMAQTGATQNAANSTATLENLPPQEQLLHIKRIYVDSFGDDAQSKQIQAMVVASLAENKRFVVTENKDRADAILKGSANEKTSQELHSYKEGTAAGGFGGSSSGVAGRAAAIEDSGTSTETIDRASIAVRLVNRDGDVIWSTKQDSHGAKYKSTVADIADKVVKQLTWAVERAEKASSSSTAAKP